MAGDRAGPATPAGRHALGHGDHCHFLLRLVQDRGEQLPFTGAQPANSEDLFRVLQAARAEDIVAPLHAQVQAGSLQQPAAPHPRADGRGCQGNSSTQSAPTR